MQLSDFNYNLPKNLIAQKPIKPRDHSRLLVLDKKSPRTGQAVKIEHKYFYNIIDYLNKGDVLVLNNSKVFPARLIGKKVDTGGKIEVFLHKNVKGSLWNCLLGGRGSKIGLEIELGKKLKCKVLKNNNDGTWEVKFNMPYKRMMEVVEEVGKVSLPPYIKRDFSTSLRSARNDKSRYQTIYAKKLGSVAAPTAGFHFTPALIKKLKKKGVQFEYVTLHVGLGTFAPVKVNDIKKHKMHSEYVEIKKDVVKRIIKAKKEKRRIIAVGTTSVRTLEGCLSKQINYSIDKIRNQKSEIRNFIYPGYKFRVIDAMITNFHLPKSTLLMLVSAFADKKNIDKAYKEAVRKKYRFFSYGDAMFIR